MRRGSLPALPGCERQGPLFASFLFCLPASSLVTSPGVKRVFLLTVRSMYEVVQIHGIPTVHWMSPPPPPPQKCLRDSVRPDRASPLQVRTP